MAADPLRDDRRAVECLMSLLMRSHQLAAGGQRRRGVAVFHMPGFMDQVEGELRQTAPADEASSLPARIRAFITVPNRWQLVSASDRNLREHWDGIDVGPTPPRVDGDLWRFLRVLEECGQLQRPYSDGKQAIARFDQDWFDTMCALRFRDGDASAAERRHAIGDLRDLTEPFREGEARPARWGSQPGRYTALSAIHHVTGVLRRRRQPEARPSWPSS